MMTRILNHDYWHRRAGYAISLTTIHCYLIEGVTNRFWLNMVKKQSIMTAQMEVARR